VPFGGGIFGVAAMLVAPKPELHHFWWLPLVSGLRQSADDGESIDNRFGP